MATVFMLSPFGDPFDRYFQKVLKPGPKVYGHELVRADESYAPGVIIHSIFQSILDSDVVVVDITQRNPNVFYELGIAEDIHSAGIYCRDAQEENFFIKWGAIKLAIILNILCFLRKIKLY